MLQKYICIIRRENFTQSTDYEILQLEYNFKDFRDVFVTSYLYHFKKDSQVKILKKYIHAIGLFKM